MTTRKDKLKRGLSLLLCVLLCVGLLPFALSEKVHATENSDTRIVDPSTIDGWKTLFSSDNLTTEYAGGIWTDKSVFTSADTFGGKIQMQNDKENFLVALSALASEQSVTGYSHIPTDTVFVLDVSRSMGENVQPGDNNNNAVSDLVNAANQAMTELLSANNNNRVGVVLYSGTYSSDVHADASNSMTLLPLGRYEEETNTFLEKDNHIFYVGTTMRTAESIKVNDSVTSKGAAVEQKEREIFGGTFVQGGVYAALNEFLSVKDTEIFGDDFQSGTKRLPVMVLMGDGVATSASTNYQGTDGSIGTSDMGDGSTPEDELATAIPFATQLTCSYAKEKTKEHYGREPLFYTLGYNIKSTPVLDPANTTTDLHWQTYDITETGSYMQLAVKSTWISSGWWGEGHWDEEYKTIQKSNYSLSKNYVDKYFYTDNDLVSAFGDITDEIMHNSLYYPTQIANGNIHHDGYVEFIDDIGQFMEVKKVHGILLGDILFTGENVAANFIVGGGKLGTIDKPSNLGDELIHSVMTRLGISETKKAQELVRAAYISKQLYYNTETGDWSNYIGWYADAEGKYLGHGTRDSKVHPENAVFYNESYGFLGEVTNEYKSSDMMYISVQVHTRIATGTSAVIFRIPASLLPVISYDITLTGESLENPGEITLTTSNTIKKDTDNDGDFDQVVPVSPMRLVFEVGVKDEINELNVSSVVGNNYKYSKDGTYDFYVSRWNPDTVNHETPSIAENTVSFFEPSSDNGRYYYAENAPVYRKSGNVYVPYTGQQSPATSSEKFYREYAVFERINDKEQGNARMHLHYEEMSKEALSVAKPADNAPSTDTSWYVPKGTIHRMYHNHHIGKGGFTDDTKTQVNSNNTNTVPYSHYLGVELTKNENGESSYYADVVHGNNGKITISQEQGIKVSAASDITLWGQNPIFTFELTDEKGVVTSPVRLVRQNAQGETSEASAQFTQGKLELKIESDESIYLLDIPEGAKINIKELQEDNDYQIKSVNGEETTEITLDVKAYEFAEANFINTLQQPENSAGLVLYNSVTHPFDKEYAIPENILFDYIVEYTDNSDNTHTEKVTLSPFEAKLIPDIPLGATVKITEQRGNGFVSNLESNTQTLSAEKELNYVIEFKNTYKPESVTPNITVSGTKNLYGRDDAQWLEKDVFNIKLQKLVDSQWIDLSIAEVSKDNNKFDFSQIMQQESYSATGVYSYRILEDFSQSTYEGITYDKSVRWFDIYVSDKDMDGQYEIEKIVPYMGTTADMDDETGSWVINTSFTNTYGVAGSDAVSIIIKNKVLIPDTKEDSTLSKAGYEFGLYQGNRLVTVLPPTSESGETMVTLSYGTLDLGKHIHYELKPILPSDADENIEYSTQVYNIAVEVQDNTQGGVDATLTITEDKEGATSVSADEVEVEFVNFAKQEEKPPVTEPNPPTTPEPSTPDPEPMPPRPTAPDSSHGNNDTLTPDFPQTGFLGTMDKILWVLFAVVMVVSITGVIITSKRRK